MTMTNREGDVEIDWEIWQDNLMVAYSTDVGDARHYLDVYAEDGPAALIKVTRLCVAMVDRRAAPPL